MLRHIILLKAPQASQERITEVFEAFLQLKKKVPGVMGFSCGQNINGGIPSQGFTHTVMMDFVDKDYFDYFHRQPEYEHIKQLLRSLTPDAQDILIMDYQLDS